MLTNRLWQPEQLEFFQQRSLEIALSGAGSSEGPFEPTLHRLYSVLAAAAVFVKVCRSLLRRHQPMVPRIFGGPLEAELVECGGQAEEGAQRRGNEHAGRMSLRVEIGVAPSTAVDLGQSGW